MRILLLACVVLMSACASPRWTNPQNPGADWDADAAACDRDAERVARLSQLGAGMSPGCMDGPACAITSQNKRIQVEAEAASARKRCMSARGWRDQGD